MKRLPEGVNISHLINKLRSLSWEAADIFLHYSEMMKDPIYKSTLINNMIDHDPVTIADLKVNDLVIKRINESFRNVNWEILSEENIKLESNNPNINSEWLWVLDPLDGTKDFIQGTENYAMHLALNYKQKPYLGIVLIPNKNELWISDGEKTWCEKRDGYKKNPNLGNQSILRKMTLVTSKNHSNNVLKELIEKINFHKKIVMGSIGCKIASIIRGESDIYICLSLPGNSAPKYWDFAAPEIILKSAGGAITNLENQELEYNNKNLEQGGIIIASSDMKTHKDLCLQVKKIINNYNLYPF